MLSVPRNLLIRYRCKTKNAFLWLACLWLVIKRHILEPGSVILKMTVKVVLTVGGLSSWNGGTGGYSKLKRVFQIEAMKITEYTIRNNHVTYGKAGKIDLKTHLTKSKFTNKPLPRDTMKINER